MVPKLFLGSKEFPQPIKLPTTNKKLTTTAFERDTGEDRRKHLNRQEILQSHTQERNVYDMKITNIITSRGAAVPPEDVTKQNSQLK